MLLIKGTYGNEVIAARIIMKFRTYIFMNRKTSKISVHTISHIAEGNAESQIVRMHPGASSLYNLDRITNHKKIT